MCFKDVMSSALRGVPSTREGVDSAWSVGVASNPCAPSTRPAPGQPSPKRVYPHRSRELSLAQGDSDTEISSELHTDRKQPKRALLMPLVGFSDPFSDIRYRSSARDRQRLPRTPGFASPGTFPSRRFARPQGFTPPKPAQAYFSNCSHS